MKNQTNNIKLLPNIQYHNIFNRYYEILLSNYHTKSQVRTYPPYDFSINGIFYRYTTINGNRSNICFWNTNKDIIIEEYHIPK